MRTWVDSNDATVTAYDSRTLRSVQNIIQFSRNQSKKSTPLSAIELLYIKCLMTNNQNKPVGETELPELRETIFHRPLFLF